MADDFIRRPKLPDLPIIGQIELPIIPTIELDDRRAIVVAGVNYPRKRQGNELPHAKKNQDRTYWRLANQYADWAFQHGSITRVIIFDFLEGRVVERLKGSATQKGGQVITPKRKPLEDVNYRTWRKIGGTWTLVHKATKNESMAYWPGLHKFAAAGAFAASADIPFPAYWKAHLEWADKESSMSIRDVYVHLLNSPAKSVHALHFFGHALTGGPIIVNTWASHGELGYSEASKKFDKDCRRSDFSTAVPQSSGFREAFADDATIGVWGCDSDDHFKADPLALAMAAWDKSKLISAAHRTAIERALSSTYATALSKHIARPVHAALPGTYSAHDGADPDDDAKGLPFAAKLMHVHFKDCARILRFYSDAMGAKFATTGLYKGHAKLGRGYATYAP